LYVTTRVTNKFKRYLYPQCSNAFIQVRNICFTRSLRMGSGTRFKVGWTSARQKIRAINMTSLTFVSIFKQFYWKFDKPSTNAICRTPYLSHTTLSWAHKCN